MKRFAIGAIIVIGTTAVFAQGGEQLQPDNGSVQVSREQTAKRVDFQARRGMILSSMVAYGSFSVGGEDRFGPMLVVQYSPSRLLRPTIDIFGGVLFQTGTSDIIDERDYIPVASYFAPYYSPFSDYRNDNFYRMPHFSIGLAFLGADVTFYMLEGEVRPYVGVGASLAFWSYSNQLSGTLAPDAKAGLDIRLTNSVSGFAEVRRLSGVPNLIGSNTPKFDGLTSAAIGISFVPRLR